MQFFQVPAGFPTSSNDFKELLCSSGINNLTIRTASDFSSFNTDGKLKPEGDISNKFPEITKSISTEVISALIISSVITESNERIIVIAPAPSLSSET